MVAALLALSVVAALVRAEGCRGGRGVPLDCALGQARAAAAATAR
jgi:hypothetical protein